MEITHFGSGICSQSCWMTGANLLRAYGGDNHQVGLPGRGTKHFILKRAMSKRDAPMDIISIAQQARPNVMGQIEFLRIQLMTLSTVVRTTPSGVGLP